MNLKPVRVRERVDGGGKGEDSEARMFTLATIVGMRTIDYNIG